MHERQPFGVQLQAFVVMWGCAPVQPIADNGRVKPLRMCRDELLDFLALPARPTMPRAIH